MIAYIEVPYAYKCLSRGYNFLTTLAVCICLIKKLPLSYAHIRL
jgi:hypothetical protein